MSSDDPHSRPTPLPPRPATQRLFTTTSKSRRLYESQEKILDALRSGVVNLVERFFGDARDTVHIALLHASHDVYVEGITRGRAQATSVFEAYGDAVHEGYARQPRDPRVEPVRPAVTFSMLFRAVQIRGIDLTEQELQMLCAELRLDLAPESEDE